MRELQPMLKIVLPESFTVLVLAGQEPINHVGKRSPNIGSPLTDSSSVASS
jgi:hypothetical protein